MEIDAVLNRYFWIAAIVATFVNGFMIKLRIKKYISENPEREAGYSSLFRGMLFWCNVPWLVMGSGIMIGGVPNMLYFFRPRDGNPYVLAWFGTVFALWFLGTFWLIMKKGAEKLVEYPGFFNYDIKSPMTIKVIWFVSLASGIAVVVSMWVVNLPIPGLN